MAQGRVRFGILGPLEMYVGDEVLPLGARKQRAVLAMLLIHRNRAVGIEELLSAAWNMSPPSGARNSLHTYVSRLRRLMTTGSQTDAHPTLVAAPPGYQLSVPDNDCDAGRFGVERINGVRAAAGACFEEASKHFATALAQWRGPVLSDLAEFSFFHSFATALAEDRLVTQIARAEAEIACGRPYSVIGELETLTARHPYREPLWAQLITAYYLTERRRDALDAYERLKSALADELGIDPGAALRALHAQILRGESLNAANLAQLHAGETVVTLHGHMPAAEHADGVVLRGADGRAHPLLAMSTRIGRSPDNNIVLNDAKASRYHAAIIDTGSNFVIADLQSANGVYVLGRRIHPSAVLADGDDIGIGDHHFIFEANTRETAENQERATTDVGYQ